MRRIVAGAVLTATAVAGMGLAATAAEAATKAPARCKIGDVKVTLTPTRGEHGMMKTGWVLAATNTSHHTCYVNGYATLTLQDAKHKALKTEEHRGSTYFVKDPGAHKIVLKPGKKVVADLQWNHIRQHGTVHATYLSVSLPGVKGHKTVRMGDPYVYQGRLFVTAFAAHLKF